MRNVPVKESNFLNCDSTTISGTPERIFARPGLWLIVSRGVFSIGAMGALAPSIFGHFSTVGKNYEC